MKDTLCGQERSQIGGGKNQIFLFCLLIVLR